MSDQLYSDALKTFLLKETEFLGKMPLFYSETEEGALKMIKDHENWLPQLNRILKDPYPPRLYQALRELYSFENPYLIPVSYVLRVPIFSQISQLFLKLIIISYLAGKYINPETITICKLFNPSALDPLALDQLLEFNLSPPGTKKLIYEDMVNGIVKHLKEPIADSLRKLIGLVMNTDPILLIYIYADPTLRNAEEYYRILRSQLDKLLKTPEEILEFGIPSVKGQTPIKKSFKIGVLIVQQTAHLLNLIQRNLRGSGEMYGNIYQDIYIENKDLIHVYVYALQKSTIDLFHQKPGKTFYSRFPMEYPKKEPDSKSPLWKIEITIPKGISGILPLNESVIISPCTEFIIEEHNEITKTIKLKLKKSPKLDIQSLNKFKEAMQNYNRFVNLVWTPMHQRSQYYDMLEGFTRLATSFNREIEQTFDTKKEEDLKKKLADITSKIERIKQKIQAIEKTITKFNDQMNVEYTKDMVTFAEECQPEPSPFKAHKS